MAGPSPVAGQACCPDSGHAGGHDDGSLLDEADILNDPTLSSCCARDIINQRKGDALRAKLLAVDVSTQRLHLRSLAVGAVPAAFHHNPSDEVTTDGDESSLASDDDQDDSSGMLEELRRKRLAELRKQRSTDAQRQRQGQGSLSTWTEAQLLAYLDGKDVQGRLVCHACIEGYEACEVLDEHLTVLAHRHPATLFVRAVVRKGSSLPARLTLPSVPALVSFRDGSVTGRADLARFGLLPDIREEEVTAYLSRLGMLRQHDGSAQAESESEDSDTEAERPCELCGRRYPHDHIKAVSRGQAWDADEDSDGG